MILWKKLNRKFIFQKARKERLMKGNLENLIKILPIFQIRNVDLVLTIPRWWNSFLFHLQQLNISKKETTEKKKKKHPKTQSQFLFKTIG